MSERRSPVDATPEFREEMYRLFSAVTNRMPGRPPSTRDGVDAVIDAMIDQAQVDTAVQVALRREHRRRLQRMQRAVEMIDMLVDMDVVALKRTDPSAGQLIESFTLAMELVRKHGDLEIHFDDGDMEETEDADA